MTLIEAAVNAVIALAVLGLIILCLYRVVLWARRRAKRAYIIGAALAPFIALGNVSDPDFRIVNEAKQLKKREEDEPGDPPSQENEAAPEFAPNKVSPPQTSVQRTRKESLMFTARVRRPTAPWLIAIVLGGMAVLTSLTQSWILLADPADLTPRAREVLTSFTVFEWVSLFSLHAMLLTAMFLLFRLRKSSVWWFAAYISLGLSFSVWYAISYEPLVPPAVTGFGTTIAVMVLAYLFRLKRQGNLA
jgi:hypothetical protein